MKKTFFLFLSVILAAISASADDQPEWSVEIMGERHEILESGRFYEALEHSIHLVSAQYEVKGESISYRGMPFYQIIAMVDGQDASHPYTFSRELWSTGYEITLTATDGYAVTFDTAAVSYENMLFVTEEDGEQVSPRIVGDMSKKLWVRDLALIELTLGDAAQSAQKVPDFDLVLDINGATTNLSIEEMQKSPLYVEGPGSYTTSAGTTYTSIWAGVRFSDLLNLRMSLEKEDTITLIATDGYEMTYSGSMILDESDGIWILAFLQDGAYLPEDPGYIRTVKVGPETPDITGHSSVRMIKKIKVSGQPFRDFEISIRGKMDTMVDRQTMQSGISCHKRTVFFERKSTKANYTGIPVWRLLAYADDPQYAPHAQDSSIVSYHQELAQEGYTVEIEAMDGFVVRLSSSELDKNDDIILAMYKESEELPENEWPLVLVWDHEADLVPEGAKPVRQIREIRLIFN